MVEGTGLENRHTGNRIEGSNPSPSAVLFYQRSYLSRSSFIQREIGDILLVQ